MHYKYSSYSLEHAISVGGYWHGVQHASEKSGVYGVFLNLKNEPFALFTAEEIDQVEPRLRKVLDDYIDDNNLKLDANVLRHCLEYWTEPVNIFQKGAFMDKGPAIEVNKRRVLHLQTELNGTTLTLGMTPYNFGRTRDGTLRFPLQLGNVLVTLDPAWLEKHVPGWKNIMLLADTLGMPMAERISQLFYQTTTQQLKLPQDGMALS